MPLIGMISDTHGRISDDALAVLSGVDRIINPGGAFCPRGGSNRQLALMQVDNGKIGPIQSIEIS